jgi:4-amino-4-deoxy-L-arabinose transferase-like glycosyltransferase
MLPRLRDVSATRILPCLLLLLTGFLHFWNLSQNGWGNVYYAAAVRSMRMNLTNFLFAAYDPAGFLSVDKPPVALWIQTLFSLVMGYRALALLLPGAIAGCLSVILLYRLVAQRFGEAAGLLSGLFLCLTPVNVAVDRMNLPDALLIVTLMLATGAFVRAVEQGDARSLLLCALFLGIGFNIKMWEALIPAPLFGVIFLCYAPFRLRERMILLAFAGIVLVAVSFSWVLFVDSVSPLHRPFVGGSRNNSAIDLILVYNGSERLTGGKDQLGGALMAKDGALSSLASAPGFYAGPAGPFRLFNFALGPQVMWWFGLIPMGIIGLVRHVRELSREKKIGILLWCGWFVSFGFVFSFAGGTVHPYYICVLAPGIAALAGIALAGAYQVQQTVPFLLPATVGLAAVFQMVLLWDSLAHYPYLMVGPLVALMGGAFTLANRATIWAMGMSLLGLCLCPLYWCGTALVVPGNGLTPSTGPEIAQGAWEYPPPQMPEAFTHTLTAFLEAQHGKERFLLATGGVYNASPIILQTGKPVMAMGGFLGSDPIVTPGRLARYVRDGDVRFVLVTPTDGLPNNTNLPPLAKWTEDHCQKIDPSRWMKYSPGRSMEYMTLFDCH